MARKNPGLGDATGHAEFFTSDALSDNQVVEVTNISTNVANDLNTNFRDQLETGEIPLPSQGSTGSAGVLSFNGATGHVQGVSSFNGATGAVVYVIDGGEI
jgi:hypothetical protein